jgi:hypothetical protein
MILAKTFLRKSALCESDEIEQKKVIESLTPAGNNR